MFLADSRQVAIRRSLLQVFCAYFAKNFTHPNGSGFHIYQFSSHFILAKKILSFFLKIMRLFFCKSRHYMLMLTNESSLQRYPMKNPDAELIKRVIDGDDTAFSTLMEKYKKSVHALAWRKIGDFHIAEEITQDTFLKAYNNLSSLKKPHSFESWLYVTTANNCKAWLRKKRLRTQSLDDTSSSELEKETYSYYVIQERERTSAEARREVVKKLLAKLQEGDRTVITLYYLGGMTYEEISRFLGVSVSAVKNRLYRARQYLKKEENMVREALENYQITPTLTDDIMQEISRINPTTPSVSKPFMPWIAAATGAVLIMLMLGVGSQFLSFFQKPYSIDSQTDMSVELINASIVQNLEIEPDVQDRIGSIKEPEGNENTRPKPDGVSALSIQENGENTSDTEQQWIKSEPLEGSRVFSMFSTADGELYVLGGRNPSIFKLSEDGSSWQHLFDIFNLNTSYGSNSPIAKWKNTLYFVPSDELFTSTDEGKTWKLRQAWEQDWYAEEMLLTESAFYIVFESGIVRSKDEGKTWEGLNSGLSLNMPLDSIRSIVEIQDTIFTGTDNGLFRLETDAWIRVDFPENVGRIRSVAVTDDTLYVAAELSDTESNPRLRSRGVQRSWWIFRSTDLGRSWTDITPTNAWSLNGWPPHVKLVAAGDTVMVMEKGMVRSTDSGDTWQPVQLPGTTPTMIGDVDVAAVVNGSEFYVSSNDGLHRSTDSGKTWYKVNISGVSRIDDLLTFKPKKSALNTPTILYARSGEKLNNTNNQGKTWHKVKEEIRMENPNQEEQPDITHIVKSSDAVYVKGGDQLGYGEIGIYRISIEDSVTLTPIAGVPRFDSGSLYYKWSDLTMQSLQTSTKPDAQQLQEVASGAIEFFRQMSEWDPKQPNVYMQLAFRTGPFAVSGDTFFMEYNYKLFRWKKGQRRWEPVGIEETTELTLEVAFKDLKLGVSGETVYVGKRDGHLVVSFDNGTNWTDLTPALPFPVKTFKDIIIDGSTAYIATDAGIIKADDGRSWNTVTDAADMNLVMEHLAIDRSVLYGVTKDTGIYRLEDGTWQRVVSKIPVNVTSLAVDGSIIYVGTWQDGVMHYNLVE